MSVVLGLTLGLGALLVFMSFWVDTQQKNTARQRPSNLQQLLIQANMERISPTMFHLLSTVCAFLSFVVTFALTSLLPLAFLACGMGFIGPKLGVKRIAAKRRAQLRDQWPDAVDHIRSAIRAGMSLPDALMQLQYRGPEPLRPAFAAFASDYRASGEFIPALNRLKDKLSDPTADNIIEALKVTREVGGTDLGRLLGTLSSFLREKSRTRSELEARQSWTINAARLACVAPWVVLALMATQPSTLRIYNSFAGFAVLTGGFAVTWFAYRLMMKIGALPEEKRVLT
ncbi:type II secretion system F family protein [Rothia nasimurium]|uniref:type II secretion system F family protein n=1 Tax=Rothia nasimurium TaxID=85336 RepID=UPI001F1D42D4|nr:type II secretion system F family protein [Rothia nasimurium]